MTRSRTQPTAQSVGGWLFVHVTPSYVGTAALLGTPDFGRTWVAVDGPLQAQGQDCGEFVVDPGDAAHLLCEVQSSGALWETHDSGTHWSQQPIDPGRSSHFLNASAAEFYRFSWSEASVSDVFTRPLSGGLWKHVATIRPDHSPTPYSYPEFAGPTADGDLYILSFTNANAGLTMGVQAYVLRHGDSALAPIGRQGKQAGTEQLAMPVVVGAGARRALYVYWFPVSPDQAPFPNTLLRLALSG